MFAASPAASAEAPTAVTWTVSLPLPVLITITLPLPAASLSATQVMVLLPASAVTLPPFAATSIRSSAAVPAAWKSSRRVGMLSKARWVALLAAQVAGMDCAAGTPPQAVVAWKLW